MRLTLEFGGGLELLCQSVKIHKVDVDLKAGEDKLSMRDLLVWVKSNLIKERPEMFVKGDSVRPGVLVLINDCDWELCGNLDAVLEEKDTLVIVRVFYLSLGDALLEQLSFDASHRQRDVDEARTELVWLEAADPWI